MAEPDLLVQLSCDLASNFSGADDNANLVKLVRI